MSLLGFADIFKSDPRRTFVFHFSVPESEGVLLFLFLFFNIQVA